MTIVEMLTQSGILTLLGLGVVFSFIVIMIGAMHLLHAVLHSLHLDEDTKTEAVQATQTVRAPQTATDNGAVVAAIATALRRQ